jgi:hypothetical protein
MAAPSAQFDSASAGNTGVTPRSRSLGRHGASAPHQHRPAPRINRFIVKQQLDQQAAKYEKTIAQLREELHVVMEERDSLMGAVIEYRKQLGLEHPASGHPHARVEAFGVATPPPTNPCDGTPPHSMSPRKAKQATKLSEEEVQRMVQRMDADVRMRETKRQAAAKKAAESSTTVGARPMGRNEWESTAERMHGAAALYRKRKAVLVKQHEARKLAESILTFGLPNTTPKWRPASELQRQWNMETGEWELPKEASGSASPARSALGGAGRDANALSASSPPQSPHREAPARFTVIAPNSPPPFNRSSVRAAEREHTRRVQAAQQQQQQMELKAGKSLSKHGATSKMPQRIHQLCSFLAKHNAQLTNLFTEWDLDGNSALDKKEVKRALTTLGYFATNEDVNGLFRLIHGGSDSHDGLIDLEEWKRALNSFLKGGMPEDSRQHWEKLRRAHESASVIEHWSASNQTPLRDRDGEPPEPRSEEVQGPRCLATEGGHEGGGAPRLHGSMTAWRTS